MSQSLFEFALRAKLRFSTGRGVVTTEQLWELPLQSKDGFDLDSVARTVNTELKSVSEESFVSTKTNKEQDTLEKALEIVKYIIAVKIAEADARKDSAAKAAERKRLVDLIGEKRDEELKKLDSSELEARLAALG